MSPPTYCKNCGVALADGSKFCNNCGLSLTQELSTVAGALRPTPTAGIAALGADDTMARLRAAIGDRYDLQRELGRGGMATVYLAKDLKHDREVAIKVLLPELSASIGADRFEREIRLAAKLQHPHILGLYDSGIADGLMYYVMPFVKGESLRDRIDREGMLPIEDAIGIALEVAGALGHAHALGIVHRDIKPENILLQGEHALVADFGIARAVSEAGAQKLTQTGMSVGTPIYMAPEQGLGETVGPTADLYSLGCVLYEMLAGEPPFAGKNAAQIMARHAMETVPSIRIVRSAVPEEVEDALFAVLGKMPADRPQSAAAFAEMLGLILGSTSSMRVLRGATAARRLPSGTPAGGVRRTSGSLFAQAQIAPPPLWKQPRVLTAALLIVVAALGAWRFGPFRRQTGAADGAEGRRVAVLYFADVSKDSSLRPLADGLTEGLIHILGTASSLTVISQNGVDKFRGSALADDSVARALRVGYLVHGEVEPKGDNVSVSLNLVDATGASIKRAAFTAPAKNLLAVRDTLTVYASDLIRRAIGSEIQVKDQRAGSGSSEAWLLLQRGVQAQKAGETHHAAGDLTARDRDFSTADSLFDLAEKADPKWSEPATRQAVLDYRRSRLAGDDAKLIQQWADSGMAHANRAISIDANDADAFEVRGNLRYFPAIVKALESDEGRRKAALDAARADLEKATTLNSRQAGAYATLSHLYYQVPSLTATDVYLAAQNALNADEFLSNANLILSRLFNASYDLGQFDRAQQWCDQARRRFPRDPRAVRCQLYMMTTKSVAPNAAEAWKLSDSTLALFPPAVRPAEQLVNGMLVAAVLARASKDQPALADSARRVAKRSEGSAETGKTREPAFFGARVYAILGDNADAIRLLKDYLAANPGKVEGLRNDPGWWFKSLETDPKWRQAVGSGP
jgi:serine/threonine-protein kinase